MPSIKFTESTLSRLPCQEKTVIYYDLETHGLALAVGLKTKTFILHRDISGKSAKISIGRLGVISLEQARKAAAEMLVQILNGIDPRLERKRKAEAEVAEHVAQISLSLMIDTYVEVKGLKDSTATDIQLMKNIWLSDWMSVSIHSITVDMVLAKHRELGKNTGEPTANKTFRYLRAILNHAMVFNSLRENPVLALSRSQSWFKNRRRQSLLLPHQFTSWYQALMAEKDDRIRDLGELLLFTGLRLSEGLELEWELVSFQTGRETFTVKDTKNGDDLALPIIRHLLPMFVRRYKANDNKSIWVFPGTGATGHLVEPKKTIARIEVKCGIKVGFHDLRRTFETTAEGLDIPYYALKRLLNHRLSNDVTAGYIIRDPQRLREPSELVAKRILELIRGSATTPSSATEFYGDGI